MPCWFLLSIFLWATVSTGLSSTQITRYHHQQALWVLPVFRPSCFLRRASVWNWSPSRLGYLLVNRFRFFVETFASQKLSSHFLSASYFSQLWLYGEGTPCTRLRRWERKISSRTYQEKGTKISGIHWKISGWWNFQSPPNFYDVEEIRSACTIWFPFLGYYQNEAAVNLIHSFKYAWFKRFADHYPV